LLPFTFVLPDMIKHVTCFIILICLYKLSFSQTGDDRSVTALYAARHGAPLLNQQDTATRYYLVKFKNPAPGAFKSLKLLKRVSYNYYIVSSAKTISANDNVVSVAASNALWKADDNLAQFSQKHPNATRLVTLVLKKQSDAVINEIKKHATINAINGTTIIAKIPIKQLPVLLQHPDIAFAGLVRQAHEELVINDLDPGVNSIAAIAANYPDVNGAGINVSIKEDRYDEDDLDLLGRSFTSVPASDNNSTHATIMATLIGGNGNSFISGRGMAPLSKFTSADFARLMPDSTPAFKTFDISVQNHSYGTGVENYYGSEAAAYDEQVYHNEFITHVFSSGNIGTTTPTTGVYNGIPNSANLSGTFKQAKNVLVIGGTGNTNTPEALSSAGPAYDGRVKPEVVTDGEDGTSGAAALTSGAIALLQQAYKQQFGLLPSSALLKSILINTANDIGQPQVDYKTGYGKLNALEALRTIKEARFKTGNVSNKQQTSYQLTVPPNCKELKVSLAWNDPPAELNAPFALVNDLDLYISTPGGTTLLPWTLSAYPLTDSLLKPAVRRRDTLNNIEQVTLLNPPAGIYTVYVRGSRVNTALQPFYIAYQTPIANRFEWTYPAGNSQLFAANNNYVRWQNSFSNATGNLSISYNHGATWQQVVAATALNGNYYNFTAPDVFTQAMLRMTINGQAITSNEFVLSEPLTLSVGYNCTERHPMLHWNPQPGATGYVIYTVSKITCTAKTNNNRLIHLLLYPLQIQSSNYYAVSAQGNGFEGNEGVIPLMLPHKALAVMCSTLLADVKDNKNDPAFLTDRQRIKLKNHNLGKTYRRTDQYAALGHEYKYYGKRFKIISLQIASPKKGINYYRVKAYNNNRQWYQHLLRPGKRHTLTKQSVHPVPQSGSKHSSTILSGRIKMIMNLSFTMPWVS
jgi:hypothetical protein